MKKKIAILTTLVLGLSFIGAVEATNFIPYGARICGDSQYDCVRVQGGQTWWTLFPDPDQRDLVRRLNRMNTRLYPGMIIAVPHDLNNTSIMDISPFSQQITPPGKKEIIVDPNINAWAAYSADGTLIKWGPASAGRDYCPDINRGCKTVVGEFAVFDKGDASCVSSKFPVGEGGAPMPYCMHFHGGYALHGSDEVPGFNASHGCVRMFVEDAQWLNQNFVTTGTTVIIKPYGNSESYADNNTDNGTTDGSADGTQYSDNSSSDTGYTVSIPPENNQQPILGW